MIYICDIMKEKIITTDKATLLVVELAQGAKNVRVETNQSVIPYGKEVNYEVPATKESYGYEETEGLALPKGNWQLLGRLPDITEEQADKVVESYEVSHNLDLTVTLAFKDYVNGISEDDNVDYDYWDEYPFDTALDSLHSLLQVNEVYFENLLGTKAKIYPSDRYEDGLERTWKSQLDFQEAQSKVWDKERTYLFLKVD